MAAFRSRPSTPEEGAVKASRRNRGGAPLGDTAIARTSLEGSRRGGLILVRKAAYKDRQPLVRFAYHKEPTKTHRSHSRPYSTPSILSSVSFTNRFVSQRRMEASVWKPTFAPVPTARRVVAAAVGPVPAMTGCPTLDGFSSSRSGTFPSICSIQCVGLIVRPAK